MDTDYSLIIAGNGIAGLTAAIYAGRSNNDPLVLKGDEPGGQLTLTSSVENYPGFPDGVTGPELVSKMEEQAEQFGATIDTGIVEHVEDEGDYFTVELTNDEEYTCDSFIAASGSSARTLDVPGEDEYMGRGVSTCATCDGAFYRDDELVIVGGGDAAFEEAHFLTKFASKVHLVHRREGFRAEDYWQEKVQEKVNNGEIEIHTNTEVVEVNGEDGSVDGVTMVHHPEGHPSEKLDDDETERFDFDCEALFIAIGHIPNTEYLEDTEVKLDDAGYIEIEGGDAGGQTRTGVEGLFAAGDVVDHHYQQAITAGGMGCKAAMDADAYLSD